MASGEVVPFKCEECGRLGYMATYSGGPFSISKKFRFCPYYGVNLDSEVGGGLTRG